MTTLALADTDIRARGCVRWQRASPWLVPTGLAIVGATAFVVVRPPVGDLWAAQARASAARQGVGLTYWFAWYDGGTAPGSYSVLTPMLSALVGAAVLGALATVAITPLCWRVARDSRYRVVATWTATIASGISLWSGRIPFAAGSVAGVATLLAVRARLTGPSALTAAVSVLFSPVVGAFVALGLLGPAVIHRSHRRAAVAAMTSACAALILLAVIFGAPGPERLFPSQALITAAGLLVLLAARPAPFVVSAIVSVLFVCPALMLVPNGLGSNIERFVWIWLPAAVIATARSRRAVALVATAAAVGVGTINTTHDLAISAKPLSSAARYASLASELDRLTDLRNYRLEAVPDGTHVAAYALLDHAMLARGYETQADNAFNAVVDGSGQLDAATYRHWLDTNAIGYVAIGSSTLQPTREYDLITHHRPRYLRLVWHNRDWALYRVNNPTPVVAAPARVAYADQSALRIAVPRAGTFTIRIRRPQFLDVDSPPNTAAVLHPTRDGWAALTVTAPGTYVLHG